MSKKFPKIHSSTARVDSAQNSLNIGFDTIPKQSFVIADLSFAQGEHFYIQAQQWLKQSLPSETLYYWALIESPIIHPSFPEHVLGKELETKWPPLLYGSFTIDLAGGRIQLQLSFGKPNIHLQNALLFSDFKLEKSLRNWSVHRWLIQQEIDDIELQNLILQFSDSNSQVCSTIEHTWWNQTPVSLPCKLKNAPWVMPLHTKKPIDEKKIMIIGAGLAGCYVARLMADCGWQVILLESEKSCALIGSGNAYSVLYPKLSAHHAPFTEMLHQAYPYAFSVWSEMISHHPHLGRLSPLWQEPDAFYDELAVYLKDSKQWFDVSDRQLIFKKSLMMNMPQLCEYLLDHEQIEIHYGCHADTLKYAENEWHIKGFSAANCVIANGYLANQFCQTQDVGIKGMRGQMTHVDELYQQNMIYCKQGHILPAWKGVHAIGASFNNHLDTTPCLQDDLDNIEPWQSFFQTKLRPVGGWVGIRGVSLDHVPVVGAVADANKFYSTFKIWQHHANQVLPDKMPNHPGLFIFTGFGSRGLVTIPWLADVLKKMITEEPMWTSNHLLQALSPARFLRKKIIKGAFTSQCSLAE
jgi:tRNA 5-methylaminomethyl-2-thiouridine biosynthesis bifunctional protein